MNLLFLVEGEKAETKIYKGWLSHIFPDFKYSVKPEDMNGQSYRIVTGYGYPSMLYDSKSYGQSRLKSCLLDVKDYQNINHFFVCIDSEEESYQSRFLEITEKLEEFCTEVELDSNFATQMHIIIQHCCIETWALGNDMLLDSYKEEINNQAFSDLRQYYDVLIQDPELMERLETHTNPSLICSTKAKFHKKYLKEYFKALGIPSSSKRQPEFIAQQEYLEVLKTRCEKTQHLSSLQVFFNILHSIAQVSHDNPD